MTSCVYVLCVLRRFVECLEVVDLAVESWWLVVGCSEVQFKLELYLELSSLMFTLGCNDH